jgi:GTP pyrophosphokinase
LKNSDTVEILRGPAKKASRDWLAHVRTGRARHKIRQWLRQEEQTSSTKLGREMLEREVRRRRLEKSDDAALIRAAKEFGLTDATHLFASLGQGDIDVGKVLRVLYPNVDAAHDVPPEQGIVERIVDRVRGVPRGVRIQGVDGLMVRYAQCCQPVPGDAVTGYVTRGRGVSIHRADCPNLLLLVHEPERRLEIEWKEREGERFHVRLMLEGNDRRGLYADVAAAVSATGTDIRAMELHAVDGKANGSMLVEVENLSHLEKIVRATRKVKGITDVARRDNVSAED